jgi:hypothetical protein
VVEHVYNPNYSRGRRSGEFEAKVIADTLSKTK